MKHITLFEEFTNSLNEAKGAPDNIVALVKQIQLGARVTGKQVTNSSASQRIDLTEFTNVLKQKLSSFNFLQFDAKGSSVKGFGSFTYYDLGSYIKLMIIATPDGATEILINDTLTQKDLKKVKIYGNIADMTDAVLNIVSQNNSLFDQISNTSDTPGEMPVSIRTLYSDNEAIKIKKAILYGVGGNNTAHAILLSALETSQPADRLKNIQNIINVLNQYLKDDYYINAAQFNNTNPQYFQFPGSSMRTRIR